MLDVKTRFVVAALLVIARHADFAVFGQAVVFTAYTHACADALVVVDLRVNLAKQQVLGELVHLRALGGDDGRHHALAGGQLVQVAWHKLARVFDFLAVVGKEEVRLVPHDGPAQAEAELLLGRRRQVHALRFLLLFKL